MLNTAFAARPQRLALLALCLCSLPHAQAQAPLQASRIAYVSSERIMTETKLAKAADAKNEPEFSKRDKAIRELISQFKAKSDKFEAGTAGMTELERTRSARELFDMEKDLARKQQEFREDLRQRQNEDRQTIAQKANKIVAQIAAEEHIDIVVLDAAWFSSRIDITDKVIKLLDK